MNRHEEMWKLFRVHIEVCRDGSQENQDRFDDPQDKAFYAGAIATTKRLLEAMDLIEEANA